MFVAEVSLSAPQKRTQLEIDIRILRSVLSKILFAFELHNQLLQIKSVLLFWLFSAWPYNKTTMRYFAS